MSGSDQALKEIFAFFVDDQYKAQRHELDRKLTSFVENVHNAIQQMTPYFESVNNSRLKSRVVYEIPLKRPGGRAARPKTIKRRNKMEWKSKKLLRAFTNRALQIFRARQRSHQAPNIHSPITRDSNFHPNDTASRKNVKRPVEVPYSRAGRAG